MAVSEIHTFCQSLRVYLQTLIDTILPPRCIVTGEIVGAQGMVSPAVWRDLSFVSTPFCQTCGIPFQFEVHSGSECASCLSRAPEFDAARAALKYDDVSRPLILQFKHGDKTHAALAFMPWLERAGSPFLKDADFLIPVPLHRRRLLKRRYNQAGLLAQGLGRTSGISVLPDTLRRHKATATQGHLNIKDRRKNVKHAFSLAPGAADILRDRTVVLVDDVYTTGATLNECSAVLKAAGVQSVYALTVARVVKNDGF